MDRDVIKNSNRLDQIENIVEKKVRTERHLEKYADLSNKDELKHAEKIQNYRDDEINKLKDKIVFGEKQSNPSQLESLKKRFEYTKNYLNENAKDLDEFTLEKTKEKQEHRKEQINWFEENKKEH